MRDKFDVRVFVLAHLLWNIVAAQNDCKPKDCYDLKCLGISTAKDGPHTIYPGTVDLPELQVSCDQETDGGGWIIYQRRLDGSVNFTRNWDDYKNGFGTIGDDTTEMWLGNENMYQLLQAYGSTKCELWVEVHAFDGDVCSAKCYPFQMSAEATGYMINWTTTDTSHSVHDISPDLDFHKNVSFATFDSGITKDQQYCMDFYKGGWWYAQCVKIFLNGAYVPTERFTRTSIYSNACKDRANLQKSCMMVRPKGDIPCNNPCKNNGTCNYAAATKRYFCMCPSEFCGAICETAKPCKVGTCEYNTTTKTSKWKCIDDSDSDDNESDDSDSSSTSADDSDSSTTSADDNDSSSALADDSDWSSTLADDSDSSSTLGDDSDSSSTLADDSDSSSTLADDSESSSALVFGVIALIPIAGLAAGAAFFYRRKRKRDDEMAAERQMAEQTQLDGSSTGLSSSLEW